LKVITGFYIDSIASIDAFLSNTATAAALRVTWTSRNENSVIFPVFLSFSLRKRKIALFKGIIFIAA